MSELSGVGSMRPGLSMLPALVSGDEEDEWEMDDDSLMMGTTPSVRF